MPFEQHERDLTRESNSQLIQMDLFERTQKKKSQQGQRGQGPWLVLRKKSESMLRIFMYEKFSNLYCSYKLIVSTDLILFCVAEELQGSICFILFFKFLGDDTHPARA